MALLEHIRVLWRSIFFPPTYIDDVPDEVADVPRLRLKHSDGDWIENPSSEIKIDVDRKVYVKVHNRWEHAPGIVRIDFVADAKPSV
jgi:hypothetical protein